MFDFGFGSFGLVSLLVGVLVFVIGLWVWFLVNRASVRANEQIRLLQEIAEQLRQQTGLLKSLAQQNASPVDDELNPSLDFKNFIPER
jgi:hypothetical protein